MSSEQRGQRSPEPAEPRRLTDAKAMRALAHPLRMELLGLFGHYETLTATQASELLGETPANCAFHLRTLAKYGYLKEAGGGRGRERPWTVTSRSMSVSTRQDDPTAALAAGELSRAILENWLDRARRQFGPADRLPGWESATGFSFASVFLTAEETEALREQLRNVLVPYESRLTDPALRPKGARPVEWAVFAAPAEHWSGPAEEPAAPATDESR